MKKFEKSIIYFIIICFTGLLFSINWLYIPFIIASTILAFCYIFGGFYFFDISNKNKKLRIISGVVIGSAVITFLYIKKLPVSLLIKSILIANIIHIFIIATLWKLKRNQRSKELKFILFRALIITSIASFFAFSSVNNSIYRNVLKRISNDNPKFLSNLLMFDEINKYNDFIKNEDYDQAISCAKKAIEHGKKWKNYDTLHYKYFSGTYEFLSTAYLKNGHKFYDSKNYNRALTNYLKADSVQNHAEYKPLYPDSLLHNNYWNKWNIAKTYDKLNDNENYDLQVSYLLNNYFKVNDSTKIIEDYPFIAKNIATNYSKRAMYADAVSVNKTALSLLKKDSIENIEYFKDTYLRLIKDYITLDSLEKVKKYILKYEQFSVENDCHFNFYKSFYYKKTNLIKAKIYVDKAISCYNQKNNNANNIFESNLLLAEINLLNSDFETFKNQIDICQKIATNLDSSKKTKINDLYGYFYFSKGDYTKAKNYYTKNLNYYSNNSSSTLIYELKIARINDELNVKYDTEKLNIKTLNYLKDFDFISPSLNYFHNELGNINSFYKPILSDSLFKVTLQTHKKYNLKISPKIGIAINGLGINELSRKNYKKADSLFLKALDHFDLYYTKNKNTNQITSYINLSKSKLYSKDISSSKKYINLAKITTRNCFKSETIYNAYILEIEGDLFIESSKNKTAIDLYRKALLIAKRYLDENHPFIKELNSKIKT